MSLVKVFKIRKENEEKQTQSGQVVSDSSEKVVKLADFEQKGLECFIWNGNENLSESLFFSKDLEDFGSMKSNSVEKNVVLGRAASTEDAA